VLGPAIDAVTFVLLVHGGWHYGLAHIVSFALGAACSAAFTPAAWFASGQENPAKNLSPWLVAHLLALPLRGGVLALWIGRWGMPPAIAIGGVIIISSMVILCGRELSSCAADSAAAEGRRWSLIVAVLGLYALVLRLVFLAPVELLPWEAYYWNYSQHLAYGYLDHPPMVAWLIRAGTAVFGTSEFGVRSGAVLSGAIASFFVFRSARELYDKKSAWIAVLIMQLIPAAFLSGFFMTPDTPLMACWAATLYFLQRALLGGHAKAWWGVGIALGLGLVSKYTVGVLAPATLCFLILDAPSRRWLRRPLPYIALILALVIFSPVIVWNAQHDWASFAFQTTRRLAESAHFSLHLLIASIIVLLSPAAFMALPFALFPRKVVGPNVAASFEVRRAHFVRIFTLVPLAVFVVFSLSHPVKFDWTGSLWLAVIPSLAQAISEPKSMGLPRWLTAWWVPTAVVLLTLYGAVLHYLTAGPPGLRYSTDMQMLPVAWRDLGSQVAGRAVSLREIQGEQPLIVGLNAYMLASELAFYAPDPQQAAQYTASQHLFGTSGLMYELWFSKQAQQGRPLLLVALRERELETSRLQPFVGELGPIQTGVLHHNGREIGQYFYRVAEDYRGTGSR